MGDRVAYGAGPLGAYSEARLMPADKLVRIPPGVDDRRAAAMMLQGMTVEYLLRRTYRVQAGDTILVHAAAGGVGLIACQWAKHLGATVIGTVGSDEKAELACAHGCDHPVVYTRESFVDRVKELTGGRGVPVVYDSVGKDTFLDSLECLSPRGLMVSFGQSSGSVPPLRGRCPEREGIALPHPPHSHALRRHPRGARSLRRRSLRRGGGRPRESGGPPDLPPGGCGRSPPRAGGPPNHRFHGARSLMARKASRSSPVRSHCSHRPTRSMDFDPCE